MNRILYIIVAFLFFTNSFSQTGINTTNVLENVALQVDSSNKGILIPRLTTAQRDAIDIDVKPINEGLIIYNTDEKCINYYSWSLNQWQSVCGYNSRAIFQVNCNSIQINGNYKSANSLDDSHYIDVVVEVTTPGVYDIGIRPKNENGYYYALKGEFITTGTIKLRLPGSGIPTTAKVDELEIFTNGTPQIPTCSISLTVLDGSITSDFAMDCGSIKVNGLYQVDQLLDASHTIEFYIDVQSSAIGGVYEFSTTTIGGINFSGSGTLTQSRQLITLQGKGRPNKPQDIALVLSSNSTSQAKTCSFEVTVAKLKKKILLYGDSSKANNITNTSSLGHLLLTSENNFGLLSSSTVKFEGWEIVNGNGNYDFTGNLSKANNPPDIVFIHGNVPNTPANLDAITQYLFDNGVVIYITNERDFLVNLTSRLTSFSNLTPAVSAAQNSSVYSFPNYAITPLNGKFAKLASKHWGTQGDLTKLLIAELPDFYNFSTQVDESVYVAPVPDPPTPPEDQDPSQDQGNSAPESNLPAYMSMYLNKQYNLFWIGQEDFISSPQGGVTQAFALDAQNRPISQSNFGHDVKFEVYNSAFLANLIQWAIEESEKNGINK
ncbi:hypothetical protein ACYSNX_11925 [Myroides sp. LJL115]